MANIRFISSSNVSFDLLSFEYAKLEKANFHKIKWVPDVTVKQYGTIVNRFKKDPQIFDCTFKFKGSPAQRKQQIDDLMFQTEYDVSHLKTGRIYWNNQYIDCYMNVHDTHPVENGSNYTEIIAQFYCPYPFWIENLFVEIRPSESSVEGLPENVKNYNPRYGYEYAYPYAPTAITLTVDSALDCNFLAVCYGPVSEVAFTVGGHLYKVNRSLRSGQLLIIDTRDSTPLEERCFIQNENGTTENVFDDRDVSSSIFKKFPSGPVVINYSRTYGIDFYVFQERSAPI